MQVKRLIAADIITLALTGEAARGQKAKWVFNGKGQQVDDPTAAKLDVASINAEGGAGDDEPVFPVEDYRNAIREGDFAKSQELEAEFRQQMVAYRGAHGGAGTFADRVINACQRFAEAQLAGVKNGRGQPLQFNKEQVLVTIPERVTETSPVAIVVQPAPVWG